MTTKRTSIIKALSQKIADTLTGTSEYPTNLYGNCYAKLKFWDEVQDFPSVYMTPGMELREYLPGDFTWGMLSASIKLYCRGEDSQAELEQLLSDVEKCIDSNRQLVYDTELQLFTTEILITSITTDEGLLTPYAIGEINIQIRYEL